MGVLAAFGDLAPGYAQEGTPTVDGRTTNDGCRVRCWVASGRVLRKTSAQHSCYARQVRGWRGGWVLRACGFRRHGSGQAHPIGTGDYAPVGWGEAEEGGSADLEVAPAILGSQAARSLGR